jgi:hypothetical protein
MIQIFIKTTGGRSIQLSVDRLDSIAEVKRKLQEQSANHTAEASRIQRILSFEGRTLDDARTLSDYGIQADDSLLLFRRVVVPSQHMQRQRPPTQVDAAFRHDLNSLHASDVFHTLSNVHVHAVGAEDTNTRHSGVGRASQSYSGFGSPDLFQREIGTEDSNSRVSSFESASNSRVSSFESASSGFGTEDSNSRVSSFESASNSRVSSASSGFGTEDSNSRVSSFESASPSYSASQSYRYSSFGSPDLFQARDMQREIGPEDSNSRNSSFGSASRSYGFGVSHSANESSSGFGSASQSHSSFSGGQSLSSFTGGQSHSSFGSASQSHSSSDCCGQGNQDSAFSSFGRSSLLHDGLAQPSSDSQSGRVSAPLESLTIEDKILGGTPSVCQAAAMDVSPTAFSSVSHHLWHRSPVLL